MFRPSLPGGFYKYSRMDWASEMFREVSRLGEFRNVGAAPCKCMNGTSGLLPNRERKSRSAALFVSESFDRIQLGGLHGGQPTTNYADNYQDQCGHE
jgi:hypothetical protein